ncbi:MAG: diaminopropionate ammonia-lyase [Acidobacteria bacterium]|nr:diaminopropionate ammonia-lyase [Acidobacteriota bacterium]
MANHYFLNATARKNKATGLFSDDEYAQVASFYDHHPQIQPTPLLRLPALAAELGIGELLVKDETARGGLPAFKITGVAFTIDRLVAAGKLKSDSVLVAATAGNHGRALARVAQDRGLQAKIYVPFDAAPARVEGIRSEGAEIIVSGGNYDFAVKQAATEAAANGWVVVSDTAWPGYEQIPRWIKAGYTRIVAEAAQEWTNKPDVVLVQGGVGGLVCATLSWLCWRYGNERPYFIACEPSGSDCLQQAARAGQPVALADPPPTLMECLRCGEASSIALPVISTAADAFVAIDDEWCAQAMRRLARPTETDPALVVGASGACGLAGLLAMLSDENLSSLRTASGLHSGARVLVILTEAATDPALYSRVMNGANN